MSSLKAKFNLEELLYVFFGVFCAGATLMWFFYTTFGNPLEFPDHAASNVIAYLSIAIVFTVLVAVFFVLIFLRKKKE